MQYIVSQLHDEKDFHDYAKGLPTPITTEQDALDLAKRNSRKNNGEYGVFKLIKKVSPPDVKIEDVTE